MRGNGSTKVIGPAIALEIDQRVLHRIMNDHSQHLVIIEIQRGAYTGEDDMHSLDDAFGRHEIADVPEAESAG